LLEALMKCSQAGLEPDGRNAHLIPYKDQVQVIFDYKGLVELAMRSGMVANIHADVVCDNDTFEYDRGELKAHKIDFKTSRGGVYAAYALVRFKDGSEKAEVMTREEIEGIRKRSRAANAGPWVTDWNEMAKKTVFRRLSKWITLSPEFRDAVDKDDDTVIPVETVVPVKPLFPELPAAVPEPASGEAPVTNGNAGGTNMAEGSHELRAMSGLCKLAGIEEADVIEYLHATGVDDSLATLADIDRMAHKALAYVHDHWQEVSANIKTALAAGAKRGETLL